MLIHQLRWRDVDPSGFRFDPVAARAIAERNVLWASGGDARRREPVDGIDRAAVQDAIDRDLLAAYGLWVAGWGTDGDGGMVRAWCCSFDSLFGEADGDARPSIDRVVAAVVEWHAFLEELAGVFAGLRAETDAMPVAQRAEHAASRLLPLTVDRTSAEDAWYRTFSQLVTWFLESAGFDRTTIAPAVARLISARFESWVAPDPTTAAGVCAELGQVVARGPDEGSPLIDGLAGWLAVRDTRVELARHPPSRAELREDGHIRFLERVDGGRDLERARRMASALEACRSSARRGEPLTFERLAAWQQLVLADPGVAFRTGAAYAKGGREVYPLAADTRARLDAALAEASDVTQPAAVRAARAYLDVSFFHPFADGNARAARLALDHVLTRAGLMLVTAEPLFSISRSASDGHGLWSLAYLIDQMAVPRLA